MKQSYKDYFQKGDPYVLLTSLGLLLTFAMVVMLLAIILVKGLGIFWPEDLVKTELKNKKVYLGEFWADEKNISKDEAGTVTITKKEQYKIGNRDIYGLDFVWLKSDDVVSRLKPENATQFERWEYGNMYGTIKKVHVGDETISDSDAIMFQKANDALDKVDVMKDELKELQTELTDLLSPLNSIRREISLIKINKGYYSDLEKEQLAKLEQFEIDTAAKLKSEHERIQERINKTTERIESIYLIVETVDGAEKELQLSKVVSFFQPNKMNVIDKSIHYAARVWEFVAGEPRESNTEGGVFPAIFGTVMMVILMSIFVVPFGVMAAIYLNEYATQGPITRMIRLSVNNLAGVPSIVYGIFGLGFFIYIVGGSIDQLFFSDKLPEPTIGTGGILWASLTLALLTLPVVVVATEEGILAVPRANKEGALALGSTKWQMIRKIVLPNAMPGILTGLILAISRGAGEVAPLMITGVVKLAPAMPLDGTFPFFHLDRKFMHLGFHIYDVGFQSPNVEAAKPMVYSTALLLIILVVLLNLLAIFLRNRLRKKYKSSSF
ncbi:MAG: phosphate ABC transporter permease PstA [Melioribacteraceae bacterium]|nr:phosphate ABC transporter permease PstA [Melioribacteraceae bacterium]